MGVRKLADGSVFIPIRSGQPCPVCGSKKGRCSEFYNSAGLKVFYRCKYKESSKPSTDGWYIHIAKDIDGASYSTTNVITLPTISEIQITHEILELRNSVYGKFRELVKKYEGSYLTDTDMKDLTERGLNEFQIRHMGFFSIPSADKKVWSSNSNQKVKLQTAITKELQSIFGDELLKVPGFVKRKGKNDNEYISFQTTRKDPQTQEFVTINGYFIPYCNSEGLMVALQYRLTTPLFDENGKLMRYFWYSSTQARSGSPIAYYIPTDIKRTDVLLLTEGATKGMIASEQLGFEGLYEAGINNYRAMVKELEELENLVGKKYKILLAIDMDKYTVKDNTGKLVVLEAEKNTLELLKITGHQVAIVEWDFKNNPQAKGIDDAVKMGLKLTYRLI